MMQTFLQVILPIFLMLLNLNGLAQQLIVGKLQGNVLLTPQKQEYLYDKIYLWGINAEYTWAKVDSARIDAQGNFVLRNPKQFTKALYQVSFTEDGLRLGVYRDVVLTQTPDTLYWTFAGAEVNSNMYFQHNAENRVLSEAMRLINAYKELQKRYRRQVAVDNLNYLDAQYIAKLQAIEKAKVESFDSLQKIIKQYRITQKGTYAADVLLSLFDEPILAEQYPQKYDTRSAFLKEHFVQEWNFADENLLSVSFLEQRMYEYLTDYTYVHSFEGIRFSVDKLLKQAKVNGKVFDFILKYLIKTYLRNGFEPMVNYIYEQYYDACSHPITSASEELKKIERLQALKKGKTAPNIVLNNSQNKPISLEQVAQKNHIILVYFWSSNCMHCQQGTAVLKRIYQSYKKQGLEIYAVSLDHQEQEWKNYLKKESLPWQNVWAKEGWKSATAREYAIRRTPTIYILDEKLRILANELHSIEVAAWLEDYFGDLKN